MVQQNIKTHITITEPYWMYRMRQLIAKAYAGALTESEAKELNELIMEHMKPKPGPHEGAEIGFQLATNDGKPLIGAEIVFNVAGEARRLVTNEYGFAKVSLKGIQGKKMALTVKKEGIGESELKISF